MALYCNSEIYQALQEAQFPADKGEIIRNAMGADASEAVMVTLNALPDGVTYKNIESVCQNASISCSLDLFRLLEQANFPATGRELQRYAAAKGASDALRFALDQLTSDHTYYGAHQVCEEVF